MGILQARILEWVAMPLPRGSFQPRDQTQVSIIAAGFFTILDTREAQDTGVGSLSLLQGIFLTQESNWGLLHCRRILYQLSHKPPTSPTHPETGPHKTFGISLFFSFWGHQMTLDTDSSG